MNTTKILPYKRLLLSSIITAIAMTSHVVYAAEQQADITEEVQAEEVQADTIEEAEANDKEAVIIVTARFRDENVRDIGQSIDLFSGDDMVRFGVTDFADIAKRTPGVDFSSQGRGRSTPRIRGISNVDLPSDLLNGPGLISTSINDIPVSIFGFNQISVHAFDLNRVEILKGPQGALFGEGAAGGVIRYFLNEPDLVDNSLSVKATASSISAGGNGFSSDVSGNLVLSDTVALRVSAYHLEEGGYIDNVRTGKSNVNDTVLSGFRLQMKFQPNDNFEAIPFVMFESQERGADDVVNGDAYIVGPAGAPGEFLDNRPDQSPLKDDVFLAGLNATYDFGPVKLQSITGYYKREFERNYYDSLVSSLIPLFTGGITGETTIDQTLDSKNITQEFRFISDHDGPFNYLAGFFYRSGSFRNIAPFFSDELTPIFGSPLWVMTDEDFDLEQKSVFLDLSYDLTDNLTISGGGRYFDENIDVSIIDDFTFGGIVPPPAFDKTSISVFLPRFAVEWRTNDSVLLYANYAEGARNGGVNSPFIVNTGFADPADSAAASKYGADTVSQVEIGAKTEWLGRDLIIDVSAYQSKFDDIRVLFFAPLNGFPVFQNGPQATAEGFEASITYQASDNIRLMLAGNVISSKFDQDLDIFTLSFSKGDSLPYVSEYSYVAAIDFNFQIDSGEINGFISYSYLDDYLVDVAQQNAALDGYETLDARIGWINTNSDNEYGVALYGKNLTDDDSILTSDPPFLIQNIRKPREIGIELTYNY